MVVLNLIPSVIAYGTASLPSSMAGWRHNSIAAWSIYWINKCFFYIQRAQRCYFNPRWRVQDECYLLQMSQTVRNAKTCVNSLLDRYIYCSHIHTLDLTVRRKPQLGEQNYCNDIWMRTTVISCSANDRSPKIATIQKLRDH